MAIITLACKIYVHILRLVKQGRSNLYIKLQNITKTTKASHFNLNYLPTITNHVTTFQQMQVLSRHLINGKQHGCIVTKANFPNKANHVTAFQPRQFNCITFKDNHMANGNHSNLHFTITTMAKHGTL